MVEWKVMAVFLMSGPMEKDGYIYDPGGWSIGNEFGVV